jgi:hypothetical protein
MKNNNLLLWKRGGTATVAVATMLLLAGCSSSQNAGAKILQIDNTKATKIISMGTLTQKQVATVKDLSATKAKSDTVVAKNGTKVPQKQVDDVVNAINTGDSNKVETALQNAPQVQKALDNTTTSSSDTNQVKQAQQYADSKTTAKDVQAEMPKGVTLNSSEAQALADQHNLANQIQLNAQNLFPKDTLTVSAKQKDGTYILTDFSSGKSYKLTVDSKGQITKKEAL